MSKPYPKICDLVVDEKNRDLPRKPFFKWTKDFRNPLLAKAESKENWEEGERHWKKIGRGGGRKEMKESERWKGMWGREGRSRKEGQRGWGERERRKEGRRKGGREEGEGRKREGREEGEGRRREGREKERRK